jgi:hypothetical protein
MQKPAYIRRAQKRAIVEKRVVSHAEAEKKLKKWLD